MWPQTTLLGVPAGVLSLINRNQKGTKDNFIRV